MMMSGGIIKVMRAYNHCLPIILICLIWFALMGCTTPGEQASSNANDSDVDVTEEVPEAGTDEEGQSQVIEWQTPDTSALPVEENLAPATDVNLEASPEVIDLAMDFAGKLGYNMSALIVVEQTEIIHSDEVWLWMLALDGENGPICTVDVRQDLMLVEAFTPFAEFAPLAVESGGDLPNLTVEALDFAELGYEHAPWVSKPDRTIYKKRVPIGEWSVCVGNIIVRVDPETGTLVGVERFENPPVEEFTMEVDQEAAIKIVAEDVNNPDLTPIHVDLVQIQAGHSGLSDLKVYWELTYELGFIYVQCDDGTIAMSLVGPSQPLGF
jgi:hypothetical protein